MILLLLWTHMVSLFLKITFNKVTFCHVPAEETNVVGNDNIVVPIAAIQICGFVLGEPVIVTCSNKTFVKYVWPTYDVPLTNVYFCQEG